MYDLSSKRKPGAFETCPDASRRPPLKKMTSCSRQASEKAKDGERANEEKKRGGDRLSFVSYRNAEGNGRSGTKVFLFPEDPFPPLVPGLLPANFIRCQSRFIAFCPEKD